MIDIIDLQFVMITHGLLSLVEHLYHQTDVSCVQHD